MSRILLKRANLLDGDSPARPAMSVLGAQENFLAIVKAGQFIKPMA